MHYSFHGERSHTLPQNLLSCLLGAGAIHVITRHFSFKEVLRTALTTKMVNTSKINIETINAKPFDKTQA